MTSLPSFKQLYKHAQQASQPVGVAAAGGADETVLEALSQAAEWGWVKPYVCGNAKAIELLLKEKNIDPSRFEIIETDQPAREAVALVKAGQAELLMKGQIATPDLMKAVLDREQGLRTGRVICQMVLMEIPRDEKSFLMTDTGISIQPDPEQKQDLLRHIVQTAGQLGYSSPRIALMAATEKVNEAMPETTEMAALIDFARREFHETVSVSGPLSFDLAYHRQAGQRKGMDDPVIGHADAMLFPNLLSANLTVKAIMYTADCQFGGVLCGTTVPVVFMSRADDTRTRLNSLAYALEIVRR